MNRLKYLIPTLLLVLGFVVYTQYPKLTIISGYAAKNMASTVFIAGRSAVSVQSDDHQVPLISMADASIGANSRAASASVFGMKPRRAVCREGLGCVLLPEGVEAIPYAPEPRRSREEIPLPYPIGHLPPKDSLFPEIDYDRLNSALDLAFSQAELQRTRTLLVLYKDHLLAERYAEGFGPDTPVLGWSMTKSILATLYGALEYRGGMDIGLPTGLAQWQGDARRRITYEQLLRMQSGLEWDEDYADLSDVNRMLFTSTDMSALQASKRLLAAPGTRWNYSSGTSNLLSGLLKKQFSTHQEYLNFPYEALIDRIGMHTMTLETDLSGTFVGSSYGWASTRDWGKFGLLYLRKGEWNGSRIFHPEWEDFVRSPTEGSEGRYGGHFWLNKGGTYPAAPRDMYMANGYQGQHVFIIPSMDLVVVRTGLAEAPDFDGNAFLGRLLSAWKPESGQAALPDSK